MLRSENIQATDDSRHHGRPPMFQCLRVGNFDLLSPGKVDSSGTVLVAVDKQHPRPEMSKSIDAIFLLTFLCT